MKPLDLLQSLVAIKSITDSPSESQPIQLIGRVLKQSGIDYRIISGREGKKNLIAQIGKGDKTVLLNSHFDVVPAEDDLFRPKIRGNKIFGRGTADAKGPLTAMITAFIELSRQNLAGKVTLCCVCDEEISGQYGTNFLIGKNITADYRIIGEPTDFNVIIAEKGFLRLKVIIFGKEAHAAYPDRGVNAIVLAARMIDKLNRLKFKINHPLFSAPTINVSTISGGRKINMVAGRCEFALDIRFLPGQSIKSIVNKVNEIVQSVGRGKIEVMSDGEACQSDINSTLVKTAGRVTGKKPVAVNFATDARFYGKNFIVFGPGKPDIAHQANEFLVINDLLKAAEYYKKIVYQLL